MNLSKSSIATLTAIVMAIFVCGGFITLGGIVNTGDSIPPGLYWKVDKPLAIGKTVVLCPPNRPEFKEALVRGYIKPGNCPDGFGNMMLKVAAKRKNIVSINSEGVYVNDSLLPNSKPLNQDKDNRPIPAITLDHYELKDNEILLMSNATDQPYDSRYFGVIEAEQVDSVISPLF